MRHEGHVGLQLVHQLQVGGVLVVGADADPHPADRGADQMLVAPPAEHVRFGVGAAAMSQIARLAT